MTTSHQKRRDTLSTSRSVRSGIDQGQPFDLYATPGYMVRRLHQIVVSLCHSHWGDLNLTPVQYACLIGIRAYPGIDQRGLARAIALDRSTSGTTVEQLERRRLITRLVSERDKRTKELFITETGASILRDAQRIAWEIQERLLQPLSPQDRDTFVRLLGQLVESNNELSRAPQQL